jgi:uncharacterized protein (DUF1810 family)
MWFIFPQIRGLGNSQLARKFAISGSVEKVQQNAMKRMVMVCG